MQEEKGREAEKEKFLDDNKYKESDLAKDLEQNKEKRYNNRSLKNHMSPNKGSK